MAALCAARDARLVSIHDEGINDAVASISVEIKCVIPPALALTSCASMIPAWIPLSGVNGTFVWSDGTPLDYTNFADESSITSSATVCFVAISVNDGWPRGGIMKGQRILYDSTWPNRFVCSRSAYAQLL